MCVPLDCWRHTGATELPQHATAARAERKQKATTEEQDSHFPNCIRIVRLITCLLSPSFSTRTGWSKDAVGGAGLGPCGESAAAKRPPDDEAGRAVKRPVEAISAAQLL